MLTLIEQLQAGTAIETEQDHSLATIAPKLSRQTAQIDWSKPATAIVRQINGLSPWPGCRVTLLDGESAVATVTLVRARPGATESANTPGTITADGSIACGDGGTVEILEIQPEGKRPMRLADFRNGRPWHAGMHLSSV